MALFVSFVAVAEAQIGVPLNRSEPKMESAEVRELVARYCRMDYAGARLNPSDWSKLEPLVSWRSNPEYPLIIVTSRFDVDSDPVLEHGKYTVVVHYRVLGKYDIGEGYSRYSPNTVQNVQFVVSEVNGDWRVTDADPNYPHPSRPVALQWLNKRLAEATDPALKTIYEHAIQELQAQ